MNIFESLGKYYQEKFSENTEPNINDFIEKVQKETIDESEFELLKEFKSLFHSTYIFYLGYPSLLTDKEWDSHRKRFNSLTNKDILDYIYLSNEKASIPHDDLSGFDYKKQVEGDFKKVVLEELKSLEDKDYYITPKYDGNSIVVYYVNGKLKSILTWSDGEFGYNKTQLLRKFVPSEVDVDIKSIQCEALVSLDFEKDLEGSSIRNKANGLINSRWMQEEVEKYITLRAFKVNLSEGDDAIRRYDALMTLDTIYSEDGRVLFAPTEILTIDQIPTTDRMKTDKDHFLVDGIVVYWEEGVGCYKFYYTEHEEVVVTNIDWQKSWSEGWSPVAEFDSVELQGALISRASLNGVNFLLDSHIGIGTKCKLVRANSTIPKLVEVLEQSGEIKDETKFYNFPKCGCGNILTPEKSQFGNSLKCEKYDCSDKLEFRRELLKQDADYSSCTTLDEFESIYEQYYHLVWTQLLNIDRFNPEAKFLFDDRSSFFEWKSLIMNKDYDGYRDCLTTYYHFSDLQLSMALMNIKSTVDAWNEYLKNLK